MQQCDLTSLEAIEGIQPCVVDKAVQFCRSKMCVPDFGGADTTQIVETPMHYPSGEIITKGEGYLSFATSLRDIVIEMVRQIVTEALDTEEVDIFINESGIDRLCMSANYAIKMMSLPGEESIADEDIPDTPLNPGLSHTSWKYNGSVEFGPYLNRPQPRRVPIISQENTAAQEMIELFDELEEIKNKRYDLLIKFFQLKDAQSEDLYRTIQALEMINYEIVSKREYLSDLCNRHNLKEPEDADWVVPPSPWGDTEVGSPFELVDSQEPDILATDTEIEFMGHVPIEFFESDGYLWRDIGEPEDEDDMASSDYLELSLRRNDRVLERMLIIYFFAYKKLLLSQEKSVKERENIETGLPYLQREISEMQTTIQDLENELKAMRESESGD